MSVDISPPTIPIPTCCGPPAAGDGVANGTKFHFSLNVSDMDRAVAFYRILFDAPPAKHYSDYAKFELEQPPLVFSLVPNAPASAGALSHFGLPVSSTEEVDAAAQRLRAAGLETTCQQGTVCGYAKQDKVWVADPDNNHWEIYVVHEHVDPESVRQAFDGVSPLSAKQKSSAGAAGAAAPAAKVIWEHRVMQEIPSRVPHADSSVDEVRLEGTFNGVSSRDQRRALLHDVMRVLKPGGRVLAHGLVSSDAISGGLPTLPGVAALVKQIPTEHEPGDELREAGFENILVTKLPESHVFLNGGIEMREIKLEALKPVSTVTDGTAGGIRKVIYKGPFARATDESGQIFERGRRTEVNASTWDRLSRSAAAKQFLFLGHEELDEASCST